MQKPVKYIVKVFYKNGSVERVQRTNKARLSATLQIKNKPEIEKYFIRVTYSPIIDNFNKKITPINEGEYFTKKSLYHALGTFTEK